MAAPDPDEQRRFAAQIVGKLRAAGHVAYWAGGCVRDELLGLVPKDYDVATSATPAQVRELFGQRRTLAVGASFGVIVVVGSKPQGQFDVATFRQDAATSDGRRPDHVTFSTPELDAQRRDFTINGLFFDPQEQRVIDFVGGQDDLRRGIVRAIGDAHQRIVEDKLRMLRGVRFAAHFDFDLDDATRQAIADLAPEIHVVSAERIAAEMARMLTDPRRTRALELLRQTGLLAQLLPEVAALGTEPAGGWHETLRVSGMLPQPSFALALAALLHRAGDEILAESIGRRWKLATKDIDRARWLLANFGKLQTAPEQPWSRVQRLFIHEGIHELLDLADAATGGDHPAIADCRHLLTMPPERFNPPPLVTGDNLVAHGIPPGKAIGVLLERIRNAQLDDEIHTAAEALALASS